MPAGRHPDRLGSSIGHVFQATHRPPRFKLDGSAEYRYSTEV